MSLTVSGAKFLSALFRFSGHFSAFREITYHRFAVTVPSRLVKDPSAQRSLTGTPVVTLG